MGKQDNVTNTGHQHMILCPTWYHLHNLKNVKNTRGGVLLLVTLKTEYCNFIKIISLLDNCFSRFLNCTNGTNRAKRPTYSSKIQGSTDIMYEKTNSTLSIIF